MKKFLIMTLLLLPGFLLGAQPSFIVLGDLHLDKFDFHDMDYVYTRPSDWKQVTKEYPFQTAAYIPKLWNVLENRVAEGSRTIVQLGDLMEGVSGNYDLARQMTEWAVGEIDRAAGNATVILTKGNHDVSNSPGQPQAWKDNVLPFIEKETGQSLKNSTYKYSVSPDIDLFVAEQFFSNDEMLPEDSLLVFLERELPKSKAKYKFLLTHQPVIPVTQRCWHLFSGIRRKVTDPLVRERFLNLLAEYRVTVLCAHLHEYSVAVRETAKGNLVQIMMVSTMNSFDTEPILIKSREYIRTSEMDPDWQPETKAVREKILEREYPFIKFFSISHTPGYAVIKAGGRGAEFTFYRGFSDEPSQSILIDELYSL